MQSTQPFLQDAISDTLLIPLAMRYHESSHPKPILSDPMAKKIIDDLGCDVSRFHGKRLTQVGVSVRGRYFDSLVRNFVRRYDDPVVVSIGCGLDTRFQRVDTGKGTFYELDLPEVIDLRDTLIPSSERNPSIAMSMFDEGWMESLRLRHPESPVCIVAEGVFMYFEEKPIQELMLTIVQKVSPKELIFDACSSWACRNSHKHETIKDTRATFKWGLDNDKLLETWSPRLRHISTQRYMTQEKKRWGLMGLLGRHIPRYANHSRMLHYGVVSL